jgi:pre-mRNA-splicing factor 38A
MSGLNSTVADAEFVHGTNPQYLIEKITRQKIYESAYWKGHCFGLNEETLLEKAVEVSYIGGVYGPLSKPTKFLCLVLKMLQLQPDMEVVKEYITQPDFKYLTALGLFYLRFIGKATDVYSTLESCLPDYRKLRVRKLHGWQIMHMDEFVDDLLHEALVLGMALPHLSMRKSLVRQMRIGTYISPIQSEWDALKDGDSLVASEKKRGRNTEEGGDGSSGRHEDNAQGDGTGPPATKKPKGKHAVFDQLFGKKRASSATSSKNRDADEQGGSKSHLDEDGEFIETPIDPDKEKGTAKEAPQEKEKEKEKAKEKEGSVRWWNKRRKMLGLKPLNVPEE